MKPFSRADRVAGLIQKTLSEIISRRIKDPRLQMATITAVKLSRDLKLARIYFSTAGEASSPDDAVEGFKNAMGYIKRTLAGKLGLRYMPELKFFYDESFDYGTHIDKLLKSIEADDAANHTPIEK